jgi:site-specific DNA recombinase
MSIEFEVTDVPTATPSDPVVTVSSPVLAVNYLRVSSSQQADGDYDIEGFSIPAQRQACEGKAEALDAHVEDEFVDRGESARTSQRPGLQAMLARIRRGDITYVIVHKVDRLARNRADDVEIVMAIRQAGAQLVSVSENIDETPSGLLVHGIMSSIAEFYSQNLATEVRKGKAQKAKVGGTLGRAPIGYLNVREVVDGREIRTVAIDPERGPLIQLAFDLYATGNYALSELEEILKERGLRSRATRRMAACVVTQSRIQEILRHRYYVGDITYRGKLYPGRHPKLIDPDLFERVQALLDAKRLSGERSRVHEHYLKGSIFCAECKGRLMFSRNTGNGGTYDYFVCRDKQLGRCSQPYRPVDLIEKAVVGLYANIELTQIQRRRIQKAFEGRLQEIEEVAQIETAKARAVLVRLAKQERMLLHKHYADEVSDVLYEEEQVRIREERAAAERSIRELTNDNEELLANLKKALRLTVHVQDAYKEASESTRKLLNQAFFTRIEVSEEDIDDVELTEPYARLLADDLLISLSHEGQDGTAVEMKGGGRKDRTPGLCRAEGSITGPSVELVGLEPTTSCMPCMSGGCRVLP